MVLVLAGAALPSGLMVFLRVVLLHIPRAIGLQSAFERDSVFEATAVAGVCRMAAATAAARLPAEPAIGPEAGAGSGR